MRSRLGSLSLLALLAGLALLPAVAGAHEMRPAYLQLEEKPGGGLSVLWKQPLAGNVGVRLVPHLGSGLLDGPPAATAASPSYVVKRWEDRASGASLRGEQVRIEGLDATVTDVLLDATFADGTTLQQVLKPDAPAFTFEGSRGSHGVPAYLRLGVEHILTGFDHLIFVLGLLLLVNGGARLARTITAFTAAHSITLTCATLGWVRLDAATVEAVIALSLVFVGVELVRKVRGQEGLTARRPWLVAFSFGLLHGFGFARALMDMGLPPGNVPGALLLFNVGVELGQLVFVAAVAAGIAAARRLRWELPALARAWPAYAIGASSSYWLVERLARAFA